MAAGDETNQTNVLMYYRERNLCPTNLSHRLDYTEVTFNIVSKHLCLCLGHFSKIRKLDFLICPEGDSKFFSLSSAAFGTGIVTAC